MTITLKLRWPKWIKQAPLLWGSCAFYVLGALCDELSSLPADGGQYHETNAAAASVNGSFLLSHALLFDALWLAMLLGMGLIAYYGLRKWSNWIAQMPAAYWFLTGSQDRYFAAIHNFWLMWLRWIY